MNIPKKFENLKFEELTDVLNDPTKYEATVGEVFELVNFFTDIIDRVNETTNSYTENEKYKYLEQENNVLKIKNKKLTDENRKLKVTLASIQGVIFNATDGCEEN